MSSEFSFDVELWFRPLESKGLESGLFVINRNAMAGQLFLPFARNYVRCLNFVDLRLVLL